MRLRPHAALLCLAALASCQPEARHLLILDLNLTEPGALASTAEPWIAAGYDVEYRRFYPHLTRADPSEYGALVLLGGRAPEAPSDVLRPSDLAVLAEWVRSGGVLILGYAGDGEGSLDRWIVNRWLRALGAGIAIGDAPLPDEPPVVARRDGPIGGAGLATFPAARNHPLTLDNADAILATAGGSPAIAAARHGNGLIVIASRHALAATGTDIRPATTPLLGLADLERTRGFFIALARWTLRPAEWARVPPVRRSRPLDLADAPRPLSATRAPAHPPAGAGVAPLSEPPESLPAVPLPAWVGRQGVRVAYDDRVLRQVTGGTVRARTLDSLVEFLENAGLTAVWTRSAVTAVAESSRAQSWERDVVRASWKQLTERLQATGVRWLPGIDLRDARLPRDTAEIAAQGDTVAAWAALDPRLWDEVFRPSVRALARLAAEQGELVPTLVLEPPDYGMASGFSDPSFRVGLAAIPGDSAWKAMMLTSPAQARYDSLLESGRLSAFYAALEQATAQRAVALRTEARRFSRAMGFGVRRAGPPLDWFTIGLLRGLADSTAPALVFTDDRRAGHALAAIADRRVVAAAVLRLDPRAIPSRGWSRIGRAIFEAVEGFWVDGTTQPWPVAPDSLARLLRQLNPGPGLPEGTRSR